MISKPSAVVYFGLVRTFKKNFLSHKPFLDAANFIIVATWVGEDTSLLELNYRDKLLLKKIEFRESMYEDIAGIKIPDFFLNDDFLKKHYRAMLPKHFLMNEAAKMVSGLNVDDILVTRFDLYYYDRSFLETKFEIGQIINSKDNLEEFSDQCFYGYKDDVLKVMCSLDYVYEIWDELKKLNKSSELYINEGFLSEYLKYKGIEQVKIDKFSEINRGMLHYNSIFFFVLFWLKKNRVVSILKKIGLWRKW